MAKTRKIVTMLVTVSVPRDMTAAEARREVRTNINEHCSYAAEEGDVKVRGILPAKAVR